MAKYRLPPSKLTTKKKNKRARSIKLFYKNQNIIRDILNEIVDKICDSEQVEKEAADDIPNDSPSDQYRFLNDPVILNEARAISEHTLDVEAIKYTEQLSGCRIVSIDYFLKIAMRLQVEHNKRCSGGSLQIQNEKRDGLKSTFILKCNVCYKEFTISNEDPSKKQSVLNRAAVWGTLSTGSTYSHLLEFLSVMDIPAMSSKQFYKYQRDLSKIWENALWDNMAEAGKEEVEQAIREGHVDSDGIPYITVYLDGGWSKRSYGHTYNAASGVAVIIGKHTGKVLFLGVRNKYCSICARSFNRQETPNEHLCFKNWTGTSSAMEQDIIVEGFKNSVKMHGVRYKTFIADGDSSVWARIRQRVDYGQQVEKIECLNHAIKNYSKNLYRIKKDTKNVPLETRKMLTKDVIAELVSTVKHAIYANVQDIENLKIDLRNTINHVFGNHFGCREYLCTKVGDTSEDRTIILVNTGSHHHLYAAINQLILKAPLLIDKETNNRAELYMSLLSRFNMGKRLNLIQRDSFQLRSYLTGLKYNQGHLWHREPWKIVFGESPGTHLKKFMNQESNKNAKKEKSHKRSVVRKLSFSPSSEVELDYGPNTSELNLSDEDINREVENLCKRLQIDGLEKQIELMSKTIGQFKNSQYVTERMFRLTASHFGAVVKRKPTTSCNSLVKKILDNSKLSTASMVYGKLNESVALSIFEQQINCKIEPSGLFVDTQYGFLGASPDGIINDDEIVEVKCSQKVANSNISLVEAAQKRLVPYLEINGKNEICLKKNHDYYYQVQGQLAITKATICHFIVFSGSKNELFREEIKKDEELWNNVMLPKLIIFYKECLGPEVILNRRHKKLKCRDPPRIIEAQKMKNKKVNKK